ncbi:restriction endonuclease subunit S [Halodesulfovibrio aestuarii]|uniref:restriction endonuclease subunit S n=1 Tax=Halodesulfovibrio aestuarii TaxID=126333 RepID=UPI00047F8001
MSNLHKVGKVISSTLKGITPKYVDHSSVIVLNQKCIRNNVIDWSFAQHHDPEKKFSESKIVRVGDILINSTGQGTAGRCAFVKDLPADCVVVVDSHILIVRVDNFYTAGCLGYSLFSIENILQSFLGGSTGQGEFDKQRLFNIITGLPVSEKQKATYDILNCLDKKIELNNQINTELEAMAETIHDYWFVQFDFPDANGQPYKTSGGKMIYSKIIKRDIPEGWTVKKLSEITTLIKRGISPKYVETGGISVLNQKCVRDQRVSFNDSRRHGVVLKESDERLLRKLDVVINSTGVGTLGRVAFVKRLNEEKTTVDSHVSIVRFDHEQISAEYLAWAMLRFQPVIEAAAKGSTGQVELSKTFLENIDVIVPDDNLQKSFEKFTCPIIQDIASKEQEIETLVDLREWLLPMLMNGQVTVK